MFQEIQSGPGGEATGVGTRESTQNSTMREDIWVKVLDEFIIPDLHGYSGIPSCPNWPPTSLRLVDEDTGCDSEPKTSINGAILSSRPGGSAVGRTRHLPSADPPFSSHLPLTLLCPRTGAAGWAKGECPKPGARC